MNHAANEFTLLNSPNNSGSRILVKQGPVNNGKIIIGGLQGMQKNKSTEEIKKTTKNFYGIFPKRLLIEVLYLLFPNYDKIAVGNKGHIYLSLRYKFKKNRKYFALHKRS